jgi:hypothetical protein
VRDRGANVTDQPNENAAVSLAPSSDPEPDPPSAGWVPPPTETDLLAKRLGIPWIEAARITRSRRGMKSLNKVARYARQRSVGRR